MDALIDQPQQGDFLIRNVMGMDQRSGVLAIGEMLKEGQLVQFHLRDADTSADDLSAVLDSGTPSTTGRIRPRARCSSRVWDGANTSTDAPTTTPRCFTTR